MQQPASLSVDHRSCQTLARNKQSFESMLTTSSLRPIEPGDDSDLLRLYTDPLVRKYLGGPVSQASAVAKVAALHEPHKGDHVWAICSGPPIRSFLGMVTLTQHHDGEDMELSYALLPEYQGKGHAAIAVQEALACVFVALRLRRVVVETQTKNQASVALSRRLGMRCERTLFRYGEHQSVYVADPACEAMSAD